MAQTDLMISSARGSAFAYRILSENHMHTVAKMKAGGLIRVEDIELAFPLIMTLSFACEIYLKILILKRNLTYNREYDLFSLFNILDEDAKTKIVTNYKENAGNDAEFLQKLQENKDVFKKWRYYYEIDLTNEPSGFYVVDTPFLDMLLAALEKTYLETK